MDGRKSVSRLKVSVMILIGLFILSFMLAGLMSASVKLGNVAKIKINGIILTEDANLWTQSVASSDFKEFIGKAEKDNAIKAILIEIDSPGGAPVASAEIADAIAGAKKPTVALIREQGTSGAYWAASAADKIVAHPLSMTGSIGVIGSYLQFSGLLRNYNISYERFVGGEYKDIGSPFREPASAERQFLQGSIDEIHYYFIGSVAKNRNMTFEAVEKIADGKFYTGMQAKKLNLVDELGGEEKAEELLKQMANATEIYYAEYGKKETLFGLLSKVISQQSYFVGMGIGSSFVKNELEVRT